MNLDNETDPERALASPDNDSNSISGGGKMRTTKPGSGNGPQRGTVASSDDTLATSMESGGKTCHDENNNDDRDDHDKLFRKRNHPSSHGNTKRVLRRRDSEEDSFAQKTISETRLVNLLRLLLVMVLVSVTILVSIAVYTITKNDEQERFEAHVHVYSDKILDSLHSAVSTRLDAIDAMATAMTSHALATGQQFPFVTLPDFALRGSILRVQAETHAMHYCPLIRSEEMRLAWEDYALQHRAQIDEAFVADTQQRKQQDAEFGVNDRRQLQQQQQAPQETAIIPVNETVLGDGTGFHRKIWSNGAYTPRGDEAPGVGPYLPAWQRSPINGARQAFLNLNMANSRALHGVVDALLERKEALINEIVYPTEFGIEATKANLAISQFRHDDFDLYAGDTLSFFAYPVMDSFEPDANVGGVIATSMYWRLLFSRALPENSGSFVCVIENSFNQTMTYQLNGPNAVYLGEGDYHDTKYDYLQASTDLNEYYGERLKNPALRAYTSVPLSTQFGQYTIKVYPTAEAADMFVTNTPWMYTSIVAAVSLFTSVLFALFVYFVERRQSIVMARVVQNAKKAAEAERDLNEFLAHEIRNPLSSAIIAHNFVTSTLSEPNVVPDDSVRGAIQSDHKIVDASLQFIDDFLRSMLLMYRASANKLEVDLEQTNLYQQVFEPVANILRPQKGAFGVSIECPKNLHVLTDNLRLKQILLNLGRNSSKFVQSGFIRLRACVVHGRVELSVEDSGPGIPKDKRQFLFRKYHTSLDVVTQGNGIGLALCRNLVTLLKGDIWLDESYDSGIPGSPGARFVLQLGAPLTVPSVESSDKKEDGSQIETFNHESPTTQAPKDSSQTETLNHESPATHAPKETPVSGLPEKLSVLFVDDDAVLRKLFMRSLRRVRPTWTIQGAESGEKALQILFGAVEDAEQQHERHQSFDLMFVDQYMAGTEPRMSGTETVREMRAHGVSSTICGLSANDMESDFLSAGADFFLLKPLPCVPKALETELLRILRIPTDMPTSEYHGDVDESTSYV